MIEDGYLQQEEIQNVNTTNALHCHDQEDQTSLIHERYHKTGKGTLEIHLSIASLPFDCGYFYL